MRRTRRGFSLMEVMLATSVLLGSSIALVELATIGRKQANSAYDLNLAQLLCQAKLDEIVAGIIPAKAVEDQELEGNPGWKYSIDIEPIGVRELASVKVSVFQEPIEGRRSKQFTLVRWVPNRLLEKSNRSVTESKNRDSNDEEPSATPRRQNRPREVLP